MFVHILILTLLMGIPLGQATASIRVRICLFEVPFMIVSRTIAARVVEDGGVVGTMVGGVTTGSFPPRPVTLQDRLPAGSESLDIKRAIRELMAHGCIRAQDITVKDLVQHELVFDHQSEAGQEVYQEFHKGRPSPVSYRLDIEPAWQNEEAAGLALQIWLRWQDPGGIQAFSNDVPERLAFDETVSVKFGQTSLVGIPSTNSGPRSIFWLAISAESIESKNQSRPLGGCVRRSAIHRTNGGP